MTKVHILESHGFFSFRMHGHTRDTADDSPNIVCAAASILGQTAVQVMRDLQEEGCLELYRDVMRPGNLELYFKPVAKEVERAKLLMQPIKTGFELLSSTYPEEVMIGWGSK